VQWPRVAVIALGGMLATTSLAMLLHRYWMFVLLQGATGFFSTAVICLAVTILSDRHESARAFGTANAMQVLYQVSVLFVGPTLLRLTGLNGVLAVIAALSVFGMPLALLLPAHGRTVVSAGVSKGILKPATLLGLLGYGIFFVNVGAYWTYVEIMGEARGMTARVVANCLAAGISAGILGGALAWALGDRFGGLWPLCVSGLLTVMAALLLNGPFGVAAFLVSGLLYFFALNYAVAYQLAGVTAVDSTGRGVAISQAFVFLGAAAGAGIAASFVKPGDYQAVIWLVMGAVCLSTALFALSFAVHKYERARCGVVEGLR
jgi:hypothetical protein